MENSITRYTTYDMFADIYDKFWGERCLQLLQPIEMFVLSGAPKGGKILDLCCGTGQMVAKLIEKGYSVTGLDGSSEMIAHAKVKSPNAEFIVSDARDFSLHEQFDGAISLLDSLNHIPNLDDLRAVFKNVFNSLKPKANFFFDLRMEEGFRYYWGGGDDREELPNLIEEDFVFAPKTRYDEPNKSGHCHYVMFRRPNDSSEKWGRYDIKVTERYYTPEEIQNTLTEVGFKNVKIFRAKEDLKFDIIGRSLFFCSKP